MSPAGLMLAPPVLTSRAGALPPLEPPARVPRSVPDPRCLDRGGAARHAPALRSRSGPGALPIPTQHSSAVAKANPRPQPPRKAWAPPLTTAQSVGSAPSPRRKAWAPPPLQGLALWQTSGLTAVRGAIPPKHPHCRGGLPVLSTPSARSALARPHRGHQPVDRDASTQSTRVRSGSRRPRVWSGWGRGAGPGDKYGCGSLLFRM